MNRAISPNVLQSPYNYFLYLRCSMVVKLIKTAGGLTKGSFYKVRIASRRYFYLNSKYGKFMDYSSTSYRRDKFLVVLDMPLYKTLGYKCL